MNEELKLTYDQINKILLLGMQKIRTQGTIGESLTPD